MRQPEMKAGSSHRAAVPDPAPEIQSPPRPTGSSSGPRDKNRPIVNSVKPAAERTTGACHPVASAYSQLPSTVRNSAGPFGTKHKSSRKKKKPASTATWAPEITSAWKVPVERYSSLHTLSSLDDSPICLHHSNVVRITS